MNSTLLPIAVVIGLFTLFAYHSLSPRSAGPVPGRLQRKECGSRQGHISVWKEQKIYSDHQPEPGYGELKYNDII